MRHRATPLQHVFVYRESWRWSAVCSSCLKFGTFRDAFGRISERVWQVCHQDSPATGCSVLAARLLLNGQAVSVDPGPLEEDPCSERLCQLVLPLLGAEWSLRGGSDVGDLRGDFAVASVAFVRPDGGSLNVIVQRHAAPALLDAMAHEVRTTPNGATLLSLDKEDGPRQVIATRWTSLMINVTTGGLIGRGVPVPFSLAELEALVRHLDTDAIESVFPPIEETESTPAGVATVPIVVGMGLARAQELLSHVGLTSVTEAAGSASAGAAEIVVAQEPNGGRIDVGDPVRLRTATRGLRPT